MQTIGSIFPLLKKKCPGEQLTFHLYISKFNFPSTQLYVVHYPTLEYTVCVSLQFTTMAYDFLALMLI